MEFIVARNAELTEDFGESEQWPDESELRNINCGESEWRMSEKLLEKTILQSISSPPE